ncbi:VanZ family protein [Microbacterium sp. A93]|uniref:VanZ family protein n=1 Tax=Microbacterium sp. A93 TaxID=3450716 RepID=UPI003F43D644
MTLATRQPVDAPTRTHLTGRQWSGWLLLVYLLPLAILVLSARLGDNGIPQAFHAIQPWLGDGGQMPGLRYGHLEAAANILLFAPIGFLVAGSVARRAGSLRALRYGMPDWAVWLLATSLSAAVELAQLFLLTERSGTLRDLICNSTGALAGVLAFRIVQSARHRATRRKIP